MHVALTLKSCLALEHVEVLTSITFSGALAGDKVHRAAMGYLVCMAVCFDLPSSGFKSQRRSQFLSKDGWAVKRL